MIGMPEPQRRTLAGLLLLCAAAYLAALGAYYVGFFNDDAFYIIGARSLLSGRFAELNAPGAPPLCSYLPGYPLLLAPLVAIFPDSFLPCQLLSTAATLLALYWTWGLLDDAAPAARPALVVLAGLNPLTISLSGTVLSDPAYLCLGLLIFRQARAASERSRVLENSGRGLSELSAWAACAGLCAAAFYIRPVGAAFVLALPAALFIEKRPRAAILCAALGAGLILPWILRNILLRRSALSYLLEFPLSARTLLANALPAAAFFLKGLYARTFFRWPGAPPWAQAAIALAGLLLTGEGIRRARLTLFGAIYGVLYIGVLLSWARPCERYLLPLLPFAAAGLLLGAERLGARARLRPGRAAWALALLSLSLNAPVFAKIFRDARARDTALTRAPQRTFSWIRLHTRIDDVFAVEEDARLHLLTGRKSLRLRDALDAASFLRALRGSGVRYVLLTPSPYALLRGPQDPNAPANADRVLRFLRENGKGDAVFADASEGTAVYRLDMEEQGG